MINTTWKFMILSWYISWDIQDVYMKYESHIIHRLRENSNHTFWRCKECEESKHTET